MTQSVIAVLAGLFLAIVLIIKKVPPVYSLIAGALAGGLLSGIGLEATISQMISGVKDTTPAIVRILSAGVLTGMLVKTGAAKSISRSIIRLLGEKQIYLALALSAMLLCAMGVFIDVAVLTIAPIAIMVGGSKGGLSRTKLLIAMIGGGKCGNIISPNPNTIISAENFGAPLPSVMAAGIIPALIGLAVTVLIIVPLVPAKDRIIAEAGSEGDDECPSFISSIAGPLVAILLLALRPICGIVIDPLVALPAGGIVGILTTRKWKESLECLTFGLGKMAPIAVLLTGTGTIAGIIKASAVKDALLLALSGMEGAEVVMAPLSGVLMCAATASTTAGATIASASFAQTILGAGISAVWGAAMVNAGATVLDHLPHGSFFHITGGSVAMEFKERLKLIPYESLIGLVLAISSTVCYLLIS